MYPNDNAASDLPQIIPITNKRTRDITGQKFGRLTVIGFVGTGTGKRRNARWLCKCECGNFSVVTTRKLFNGHTKSCGCFNRERMGNIRKSHGMSNSSEFAIWCTIIARCENPNQESYKDYGGRGITICQRWRHSFENFIADMGPRPGPEYSIDRIDNDLGYSPTNCRWATRAEQASNTRRNRYLEFHGETLTIKQWADKMNLTQSTIHSRIDRGWPVEKALTTPLRAPRPKHVLEFNGERMTINEWSEKIGVHPTTIGTRLYAGWSVEKTLTTPARKR